jgi:hypothetical protein
MALHRFRQGQQVEIVRSTMRFAAAGVYEVVALLPLEGDGPKYRLKGRNEKHERVVAERDLLDALEVPA